MPDKETVLVPCQTLFPEKTKKKQDYFFYAFSAEIFGQHAKQ